MKCYQHQKLNFFFFFPQSRSHCLSFQRVLISCFAICFIFVVSLYGKYKFMKTAESLRCFSDLMFMKLKLGFSCTGGSECCKLSGWGGKARDSHNKMNSKVVCTIRYRHKLKVACCILVLKIQCILNIHSVYFH